MTTATRYRNELLDSITAESIFEFCDEYSAAFGLRVQDRPMAEGEMLPCSWHKVDDGEHEGEMLDGTCAVGLNSYGTTITIESVEEGLEIAREYPGKHIAIVWADEDRYAAGWDPGEVVLRDCRVVKVIA